MGDGDKKEAGFGGYVLVALITAAVVFTYTNQTKPVQAIPMVSTSLPPESVSKAPAVPTPQPMPVVPATPPSKPAHFFDSVEGSTYYYGRAVSDEERKMGKRAPEMIAFWYLGRDEQGRDVLQNVTSGRTNGLNTCARPCKVIHQNNGTAVGFDTDSIIGAAFADAQRGFLKKHLTPSASPKAEDYYYVDENGNLVEPNKGGQ